MDFQNFIDKCIQEHNMCRQLHGIAEIKHCPDLDKGAQGWASVLGMKSDITNSPRAIKKEIGENIGWQSIENPSGTDLAKQWYAEIKNYDFLQSNGNAKNFTQMIWKSTIEVGFGMAEKDDKYVIVAHYQPPGNIANQYAINVLPKVRSYSIPRPLNEQAVNGALDEAFGEGIRPYIDIIDNLRRYGLQQYVELPNVVVVGDQSSGKSSIIEVVSGIQLPRGTGIVTRCPLELQLKKVVDQPWKATISYKMMDGDEVVKSTSEPQKVTDFVCEGQNDLCGTKKGVSKELITLRIESPDENAPDLTMIDLPGIARIAIEDQPEDICDRIKDIIMSHVSNSNTVILCVIAADLDISVNESINIARKVDKDGLRTIGVITKPDIADMDHKLEVLRMLENKKIDLKKGFNVVKCRSPEQLKNKLSMSEFLQDEMNFYEDDDVYREADISKCGALNLSKKITDELVHVIKNNLPKLQINIETLLQKSHDELDRLPLNIPESYDGKRSYLMNIAIEFNDKIKAFFLRGEGEGKINYYHIWREHFNNFQHQMEEKRREAYNNEFSINNLNEVMMESRGKEVSGFISYSVFEDLIKTYIHSCKPYAANLLSTMRNDIKGHAWNVLSTLTNHLPEIGSDMQKILNLESEESLKASEERIDFIFKQEAIVFTMDSVFDKKWEKNNNRGSEFTFAPSKSSKQSFGTIQYASPLPGVRPKTTSDNSKRMQNFIICYLKILHTRLCDYIPMAIMRCLLIQHQEDLKTRMFNYLSCNETVNKCHECKTISAKRSKLTTKISCLLKGKKELDNKYNILN